MYLKKGFKIFVPLFLIICFIFAHITPFIETSEEISEDVFRLHILANSDTAEDQKLKLKVRDEILIKGEEIFKACKTVDEAEEICRKNIDFFEQTAESCIKENGYDYTVRAYVDEEYFNTREYETITLPSGIYNALKIEIGEAQGKNWWCVMFPAICLPSVSDDEINSVLTDDEIALINSNNKYEIRFKIVEVYEKIKDKIINKSNSAK